MKTKKELEDKIKELEEELKGCRAVVTHQEGRLKELQDFSMRALKGVQKEKTQRQVWQLRCASHMKDLQLRKETELETRCRVNGLFEAARWLGVEEE